MKKRGYQKGVRVRGFPPPRSDGGWLPPRSRLPEFSATFLVTFFWYITCDFLRFTIFCYVFATFVYMFCYVFVMLLLCLAMLLVYNVFLCFAMLFAPFLQCFCQVLLRFVMFCYVSTVSFCAYTATSLDALTWPPMA